MTVTDKHMDELHNLPHPSLTVDTDLEQNYLLFRIHTIQEHGDMHLIKYMMQHHSESNQIIYSTAKINEK